MFVEAARTLLKNADTRLLCVDVGSAGGFHARLEAIRAHADILGFDADPDECARLNSEAKAGERHINAAIGRDGENLVVELHKKRKTSSCYETATERVRHFHDPDRFSKDGEVSFTTRSLDSVCAQEKLGPIDYLKVDVEGHELAVLEGYSGPLLAAEIEVCFHPFRRKIPLVDQVMQHMRQRGFLLVDLRRTYWRATETRGSACGAAKGLLMHGDALFMLDPFLDATGAILDSPARRAKYLALLCLYGYGSEALMTIDVLTESNIMPADEAEAAARTISEDCARHKPLIQIHRGRRLLSIPEKWVQLPVAVGAGLFTGRHYWADGELGNW